MRRTIKTLGVVLVLSGAAVTGLCCGGSGSCVASAGIVDECKQDWTRAECAEWDDIGVNGATWTWSGRSCESRGFDVQCSDGSYVRTSSDC